MSQKWNYFFLGIYDYAPTSQLPTVLKNLPGMKAPKKQANEEAKKIIAKYHTPPPTSVSSIEDRQLRVISRFVNEALLCLEEGIIATPVSWLFLKPKNGFKIDFHVKIFSTIIF